MSVSAFAGDATSKEKPAKEKKAKQIKLKTWGALTFEPAPSACETMMQDEFGFTYIVKAGHQYRKSQNNRWTKQNKKRYNKISKKNGNDWELKFQQGIDACQLKIQLQ